jgi:hypothetical protein
MSFKRPSRYNTTAELLRGLGKKVYVHRLRHSKVYELLSYNCYFNSLFPSPFIQYLLSCWPWIWLMARMKNKSIGLLAL